MATPPPVIEARRDQMFPVLDDLDIAAPEAVRRDARHWPAGSCM